MHPKQLKELPPKNEPWNLIRSALADMEEQEKQPQVVIDMSDWHMYNKDTEVCELCLAGCVMQSRFEIELLKTTHYSVFDPENMDKFMALNYFVYGRTKTALSYLGYLGIDSKIIDVNIVSYRDNPTQFKQEMLGLADLLEKEFAL